jgi:hypothetical protein
MKSIFLAVAALFAFAGATGSYGIPSIVVYPFATSAELTDPAAGGKLAFFISTRLSQLEGVSTKEPLPDTTRAAYLSNARAAGADYYVSGYVTPLGNDAMLVVQLVSTATGIQVWSDTTEVHTYNQATAESDAIRNAVLAHFSHSLPSYSIRTAKPAIPSPSATTAQTAPEAHTSAAIAPVVAAASAAVPPPARFTPAARATPASGALPSAASAAPPAARLPATVAGTATSGASLRGPVLVLVAGGTASPSDRTAAAEALVEAIKRGGIDASLDEASSATDLPAHLSDLCSEYRVPAVVSGTLQSTRDASDFVVQRYDCDGTAPSSAAGSGRGRHAIDNAVNAAWSTYLKLLPRATGPASPAGG